eukprot:GEMP01063768.1.p1 GENE.GEMP01063768.1~~GEMP01063768.1.p1  ORF type:complete len:235 (+),score=54.01 GEMP01063768.1:167-871(+)
MPIVTAKHEPGIAVDLPCTKRAKPVFIDFKRTYPREKRITDPTAMNMILDEKRIDNRVEENAGRWANNGFQGNVQYVTYFGRAPIRPGEKLARDLQAPTFPKENTRALNTSQMGRAAGKVKQRELSDGASAVHKESAEALRKWRSTARWHEKNDECYHYRATLPKYSPPDLSNMNPAGLASIHPAMGTSGSLPDLSAGRTNLAGHEFLDKWRNCTPYAYDEFRNRLWPWPNDPL